MYARLKSDARHIKAMFQVFGWWENSHHELKRFNDACRVHCGHDAITVSVDGMNGFVFYKITTVSPTKDYGGFGVAEYEIIPAAELRERAERIAATGERKHIVISQGDHGYLLHKSTYSPFHKTNLTLLVDDWLEVLPTVPREAGPVFPDVNVEDKNHPVITWKGVPHPVKYEGAQLFLLLIEHYPKTVSVNKYFPEMRVQRIKDALPEVLANLIDSGRGKPGTSLVLEVVKK